MNVSPEAVKIMLGMPGTDKQVESVGEYTWRKFQTFCDNAQISMINRHIPFMDIETRRRAELVKAGQYHGQKVN